MTGSKENDQARAHADLLTAAVDLIRRTGAGSVTVGWSDDHDPPVWFAVASYPHGHEAGGAMTPLKAVLRLLDRLIDGGECAHCHRPAGVVVEPGPVLFAEAICWYQYDPERKTFRRGCEGSTP